MRIDRSDFLLGSATLLLGALLVGTILFMNPLKRTAAQTIVVQFEHSQGVAPVREGSPVLLAGAMQVGTVSQVQRAWTEVVDRRTQRSTRKLTINVSAQIDADIELYGDCQITTDQPPVGGGATLVILDVGTMGTARDRGRAIVGLPPQSLGAAIGTLSRRLLGPEGVVEQIERLIDERRESSLVYKVARSLDDINAITAELRTQLSATEQHSLLSKVHGMADDLASMTRGLRGELDRAVPNSLLARVASILESLAATLAEATGLLTDNRATLAQTVRHVESLTARLDGELMTTLLAELNRDDPNSILGRVHAAMNRLNGSLADIQAITAAGRDVIVVSKPAAERTIANAREMSEQLRLASEEIRLAPWKLLYRPSPRETSQMTVFEAARTFAEAATYLDDAAARLEAATSATSGAAPASAAEIDAIIDGIRKAFERFKRAEDFLFQKMGEHTP
ncbi:MAG: hypothetical protein CHACPFDD_04088 [Phycisphaerae bacterium]|nr:hypothetical protein [Phycisphaerae bacterium]